MKRILILVVLALAAYPVGVAIALRLADWFDTYIPRLPARPLDSWGSAIVPVGRRRR